MVIGPVGISLEWVSLVGFLVIFYPIIWRPRVKRAKEHGNLLGNLQKSGEVVTSDGTAGKVTKIAGDFVVVKVFNSVELKFQKAATAAILLKGILKTI